MGKRRIVFLTGTRADFGKIKSLIARIEEHEDFEAYLFVTGMHLMHTYGYTMIEVERCNFKHVHAFENHTSETTMELTLAKTITGFSSYIQDIQPDMIVVHGDRVEALAGAIVGSLNNILVAHIEGGEISGTIDELIRHATSKMSHIHYVSHQKAQQRLQQMGEVAESIFVIGSPDVDIMFSDSLPGMQAVRSHYEIDYQDYGIVLFHPVTTEAEAMHTYAKAFVEGLLAVDRNFVVIYPNNDLGSTAILKAYEAFEGRSNFRVFPSIRFEYFLTLLKHADFIIGNSSAGIREAPYYGVPTLNVGTRQLNRAEHDHIIDLPYEVAAIAKALAGPFPQIQESKPVFGNGQSHDLFIKSLETAALWDIDHQKQFKDTHE